MCGADLVGGCERVLVPVVLQRLMSRTCTVHMHVCVCVCVFVCNVGVGVVCYDGGCGCVVCGWLFGGV